MRGEKINGDYYKIVEDEDNRMIWSDYLKWSKPTFIRMRRSFLKLKIQDFIIPQLKEVVRFIVIEHINDDKVYQSYNIYPKKQKGKKNKFETKERKNIECILEKIEEASKKTLESSKSESDSDLKAKVAQTKTSRVSDENKRRKERFEIQRQNHTERENVVKKAVTFSKINTEKNNDFEFLLLKSKKSRIVESAKETDENKNLEVEKKQAELMKGSILKKFTKMPSGVENSDSLYMNKDKRKRTQILKIEDFEKSKNSPLFKLSKLIHHHPKLNLIRNANDIVKSKANISKLMESDVHFTGQEPTSKLEKNIFNVSKIDIKKISVFHKSAKTAILIIIIISMINIFLMDQKLTNQELATKEIPTLLVLADIFCWVTWVEMYGIISLEGNRAVREGWIDKNDMKRYLHGKSYWEDTYAKQFSSGLWAFVDIAQKNYDQKLRNIDYPELFHGYDEFFDDQLGVDFYKIDLENDEQTKVNPEKNKGLISIREGVEWYKIEMQRYDSLKLLELAGNIYKERNYENDTLEDIPSLGKNRDRDKDPFEDYLRKLLIGESLYRVMIKGWDTYEYLKDISRKNENSILFCSAGAAISSGILLLGLLGYLLKLRKEMNDFYQLIFSFKASFFF